MSKTERGAGKGLSPVDRDLWRKVTEEARPLAGREAPATPDPPPQPAKPAVGSKRIKPTPARPARPAPELAPGTVAGVDRRTAGRLRRGQMPIEGRLDLHGLTQVEAHRELDAFLARAEAGGKRCLLIITGRGATGGAPRDAPGGATREAGGVLRRSLPDWLNQPPNRERILAIMPAQPKHGGAGALYVLLKRQRDA